MKVMVTGGAGFIGSAVVRRLVAGADHSVVNVDRLTYAADLEAVAGVSSSPAYAFEQVDICDSDALAAVFERHKPDAVIHLAAETHVDRSIEEPMAFVRTNVVGTAILLKTTSAYLAGLGETRRGRFRFVHVSTDEVYGPLTAKQPPVTERQAYAPSSPYAASKAAADHMVRAWGRTYGFPAMISAGSNTYGPFQFPEKLVPLTVRRALAGEPLVVYGQGEQVRDWLHVEDHARALETILGKGRAGQTYNVGGGVGWRNIDIVRALCAILETLAPDKPRRVGRYEDLITFAPDRPGHDLRYAMDISRTEARLGWTPRRVLREGLEETVAWMLKHPAWLDRAKSRYDGARLGAPP